MKQLIAPNAAYWEQKLAAFFHDPPDKALHIPGHVKRGAKLINAFGLSFSLPDTVRKIYKRADAIASGMDRTQLPSFYQNGAVYFRSNPLLTHPTGANPGLGITLPETASVKFTTPKTVSLIQEDMQTFSSQLSSQPDKFAASRFLYSHLLLRERLASENICGLGGLWYKLPADTRVPDHSIWQHCALVSALSSCFTVSDSKQASLMVMSLTPVQDFITRSRKLRDLWTSSVLLSWLTFEGIREVVRLLGSDHILYPSLSGQPLMYWLLEHEYGLEKFLPHESKRGDKTVASLPNKFVCLVPAGKEEEYALMAENAMRNAWTGIGDSVLSWLGAKVTVDQCIRDQFKRQMGSFFACHWSACPLVAEDKQVVFKELLPESTWGQQLAFYKDSRDLKIKYPAKGEGAFYPVTHALIQTNLAAGKTRHTYERTDDEPGIKCQLHGELEALHYTWKGDDTDKNPSAKNDPFWKALRNLRENSTNFKETERLSSVALVKRLVSMAIKQTPKNHNHPLAIFFSDAESFPSTTEMALADWLIEIENYGLDKKINRGKRWKAALAQHVHTIDEGKREKEIDDHPEEVETQCRAVWQEMKEKYNRPVRDSDKYYAILLMDGDRMRDLVNGESIASKWSNVIHDNLIKRMNAASFDKGYHDFWQKHEKGRRAIAPAVHAAISEALGDFALHAVPSTIKKHRGKPIYVGGDDICAILPASTALAAAKEIADYYRMGFVTGGETSTMEISNGCWTPTNDRLRIHLGQGEKISISAGILIVHHKRPLKAAIHQARILLEKAKEEGGRNAFALELKKRAGGSRFFVAQWDEKPSTELGIGGEQGNMTLLDHFHAIAMASANKEGETLSSSLLYKFGDLQPGLITVLGKRPDGLSKLILAMVRKKPEEEKWMRLAENMAAILGRRAAPETGWRLDHDPLIIARFLGPLLNRSHNTGRTP